jgi:hypothetical protein
MVIAPSFGRIVAMLSLAALLLLSMSAPTPVAARGDVDPMVAFLADTFRAVIGGPPVGQMRIIGVRGEDRILILNIDLSAEASALFRPPQVAMAAATGICSMPRTGNFFGDGRALRVEVTRVGRAEGSATVDRCPGPAGQGLTAAAFAGALQSMVGVEENGATVAAIRAEGNAVVVTMAFPAGTPDNGPSQSFVLAFCRHPEDLRGFFGSGLTFRVDTKIGERDPVPGRAITACPPR